MDVGRPGDCGGVVVEEASRDVGVGGGLGSLVGDSVGVSSPAGTWGKFVPDVRGSKGVRAGSWRCGIPLGAIMDEFLSGTGGVGLAGGGGGKEEGNVVKGMKGGGEL